MKVFRENADEKLIEYLTGVIESEVKGGRIVIFKPKPADKVFIEGTVFINTLSKIIVDPSASTYFLNNDQVVLIVNSISKTDLILLNDQLKPFMDFVSLDQLLKVYSLTDNAENMLKACQTNVQAESDSKNKERWVDEQKAKQQRNAIRDSIMNRSIDLNLFKASRQKAVQETKPRILVVDDDSFSGTLVRNNLKGDHTVTLAECGSEGIDSYFKHAPDIVFLDINLPDVSGHDVLNKILAHDSNAFIVMLSGNSDKDNILKAVEDGAKGFMGKPFTRSKLLEYIARCPRQV